MVNRRITLYVQSIKAVAGTQQFERIWAWSAMAGTRKTTQTKYEYVLPDEQETIVKTVKNLCDQYGFELEIVDVTREKILDKVMHDNIKGIDVYPALLSDSDRWIEGISSKEQAESFLSKEKRTWL